MKKCPNPKCGHLNDDKNNFCEYCGHSLNNQDYERNHIPWSLQVVRGIGFLFAGCAGLGCIASGILFIYSMVKIEDFYSSFIGGIYFNFIPALTGFGSVGEIRFWLFILFLISIVFLGLPLMGYLATSLSITKRKPGAQIWGLIFFGITVLIPLLAFMNEPDSGLFWIILFLLTPVVLLVLPGSTKAFRIWRS